MIVVPTVTGTVESELVLVVVLIVVVETREVAADGRTGAGWA